MRRGYWSGWRRGGRSGGRARMVVRCLMAEETRRSFLRHSLTTTRQQQVSTQPPRRGPDSSALSQAFNSARALYLCDMRFCSHHEVSLHTPTKLTTALDQPYPASPSQRTSDPQTQTPGSHPKALRTPGRHNPAWCPALKQNRFLTRPSTDANVQTATADLSEYAASRLLSPSWPSASRKYFLRGC